MNMPSIDDESVEALRALALEAICFADSVEAESLKRLENARLYEEVIAGIDDAVFYYSDVTLGITIWNTLNNVRRRVNLQLTRIPDA